MPCRLPFCLILLLSPLPAAVADEGLDFFEKKIRPLLVQQCYSCHSAQAKSVKGGLLLDSREATRRGGDSGPAVVPGRPDESLILAALAADGSFYDMPPDGKLSDTAIADVRRWIEMGAPDPREGAASSPASPSTPSVTSGRQFWAFQPPRPGLPPDVADPEWPVNSIDSHLAAARADQPLTPAPAAERSTLLRRLYYDLTGLPPSVAEVDALLSIPEDQWEQAYDRVLDRLLATPQFGERWGRHWLDLARYADSSGGGRTLLFPQAWRYRDYVVDSFNRDQSFRDFIQEQICGDLLPAETLEEAQRHTVATAFLVLGPTNYERQDKQVLEYDVIDEQLETVGRALLGKIGRAHV